ncbi:solute carrier family 13 (sodium-dependent dicarboxylate transporter), member 2/3/5 [Sporobacter termitidis DSM 10068]|uniref:Solute carrier family 13 (Sodium-dependent dicarboxylate transporter), member 2/3/5 n=1 Tax=Sporobacter termitidis DSM 10068 TaxID=1123282 RepID=A0A1M5XV04_9FIRM|nr:SLC13 family permease [Sporobacter termitidis]SHI03665.1 solute carrier family 13 (sodium-dependent dicarboxylate transporter), member 2/3/5 [Sporobacter termitidis DSM 10068]
METQMAAPKKTRDALYFVKSIIGLAIMIFFQYIPAPAPITPTGMAVIGMLLGLIFLWTFVDIVWPTFAGILIFGFHAFAIYPKSISLAGIYEAGAQSFGNWCVVFIIGCLLLTLALEEAGTIRRITMWFLSRKFARKSPWAFTTMFLGAALLVGLFLDVSAAQFFMLGIAHQMFELLGFKKGEKWPTLMIIGLTFTTIIAFAATPICHAVPIMFMGIYSSITGQPVNMLSYILVGVPIGLVLWGLMLLWFRYVGKPDVSQLENIDYNVIESMKPGPMDKKEKIVVTVSLFVVVCWLLPGFMSFLAPNSPVLAWFNAATATAPMFAAIPLLAIIRIDGKPILNVMDALQKLPWYVIAFLAGIMMIASAVGEQSTGIPAFMAANLAPITNGLSPFVFVTLIAVLSCVLANFLNHVPVGIIFVSVSVPAAIAVGINPLVMFIAACLGANLGFAIPPAMVPIGVACADEWGSYKTTIKNGFFMLICTCVVLAILVYPLSSLVFGR